MWEFNSFIAQGTHNNFLVTFHDSLNNAHRVPFGSLQNRQLVNGPFINFEYFQSGECSPYRLDRIE